MALACNDWTLLERLSASEQLYYHDAPVAHVVAYQERLRATLLAQRRAGLSHRR